jgi:hypothetical protein
MGWAAGPLCRRAIPGMHLSSSGAQGRLSSGRQPLRLQQPRRSSVTLHAGRDVDIADRAVSAVPYLVPLFDGLKYGAALNCSSNDIILYRYILLLSVRNRTKSLATAP